MLSRHLLGSVEAGVRLVNLLHVAADVNIYCKKRNKATNNHSFAKIRDGQPVFGFIFGFRFLKLRHFFLRGI